MPATAAPTTHPRAPRRESVWRRPRTVPYPASYVLRDADALWMFSGELRDAGHRLHAVQASGAVSRALVVAGFLLLGVLARAEAGVLGMSDQAGLILLAVGSLPGMLLFARSFGSVCVESRRGPVLGGLDAVGGPACVPVGVWRRMPWPLGPDSAVSVPPPRGDARTAVAVPQDLPASGVDLGQAAGVAAAFEVGRWLRRELPDASSRDTFTALLPEFDDRASLADLVAVARLV